MLQCPICKEPLSEIVGAYQCIHKHTFNISKKQTVNFVNTNRKSPYDTTFFENRHRVLNAGYFDEILNVILSLIEKYDVKQVLDAGSGEGYFSKGIKKTYPKLDVYGLDYAKDGIKIASMGVKSGVHFMVGDISNLPFQDKSVDMILNVFSPANYQEFERVLKVGGILIKVMPMSNHFKELRESDLYEDDGVLDLMIDNTNILESYEILKTYAVPQPMQEAVVKMSPIQFYKEKMIDLKTITIHAKVWVAKFGEK